MALIKYRSFGIGADLSYLTHLPCSGKSMQELLTITQTIMYICAVIFKILIFI